jgi:hypothetical protein
VLSCWEPDGRQCRPASVDLLAKVAAHWQQVSASQQDPGTSQTKPAAPGSKAPKGQRTAVSTPMSQRPGRSNTSH